MFSRIIDTFRDEEDHDPAFIGLTRNIVIFIVLVNAAALPLVSNQSGEGSLKLPVLAALTVTLILEIIALFFIFPGNVYAAKVLIPFSSIVAITALSLNANGLNNPIILGLPFVLIISALLLGRRSIALTIPGVVLAIVIIAVLDLNNKIPSPATGVGDVIIAAVFLIGCAVVIQAMAGRLNHLSGRAGIDEQIPKGGNLGTSEPNTFLEKQVHQLTAELESINKNNLRRARQYQAIALVNQAITSIHDLDRLLQTITEVISEQFDIYHTGIFLLDENREFAVLRASNSIGGKTMLERGHKLQVSQTGIVGFVTATGQPRIAMDVGSDTVYFNNPDLPGTRSEIALPLWREGRIIGALDVQSTDPNAFNQDDMEILSTLAAQVSTAINITIVSEIAKVSLAETQSSFRNAVQESWKVMRPTSMGLGYELKNSILTSLDHELDGEHIREAVANGKPVFGKNENAPSRLAIPIHLRGQVVGVMDLSANNQRKLTTDEVDIAKAVTERLSLAIETATLIQSTQHRADVERLTTEITAKISSSTRFETILKTAAEELSKALSGSDVLVQIEPISIELGME